MNTPAMQGPVCPLPLAHTNTIVMGHGSGGQMSHELIENVFQPFLAGPELLAGDDFAFIDPAVGSLAVSTDAHIVKPLIFPGGDIGRLAVCGTVNDVAVSGANPLYLTASFILEEGLAVAELIRILESMRAAAEEAAVRVVAADTKVAEKGSCDGLFISTTGVGIIPAGRRIDGSRARPGDAVLLSGTLGDHGIAVLSARGDLGLTNQIQSDVAPLNGLIRQVLESCPNVHVMRDPTRGGLGTTLNEICRQSQVSIQIDESLLPVHGPVSAACEMLGFDPLYVANEGKVVIILPEDEADAALQAMRSHHYGKEAVKIGTVRESDRPLLTMKTRIGATRIIDMLSGEILPRIC